MADNYFAKKRREREGNSPVQLTPADPTLAPRVTQAQNQAAASALDPQKAAQELRNAQLQEAINRNTLAMKERELKDAAAKAAAEAEDRKRAESVKAEQIAKIASTIQRLDAIANDANDNGGWFETGKSGNFGREWFGKGSPAYDLDKKIGGVRGANFVEAIRQLKESSKTGATGAGGLTETEGKKLEDALAVLDPNMSHQEFMDQVNLARETYLRSYRSMGGDDPLIDPSLKRPDAPNTQLPPDRNRLSTETRTETDPYLRGVAGKVGGMLIDPRRYSDKAIMDFMRQSGVDPASTNIQEALRRRKTPEFIEWQRQNPGRPYPVGTNFYTKEVPLSPTASLFNSAAQSAPGAATIAAANAVSGNNLGNIAGDEARLGMDLLRTERPGASFFGDVAGQAMFEATAGRLPGVRALRGRRFSGLGSDLAYGGITGLSENGSIGEGLMNAGGNALGGVAGRGVTRAVGGAMRGINTPSLNYLRDRDVPLTIGQIARGSNSTAGNIIGGLEDRAAGFPVFDGIINTARRRGQEGFNRAAFREIGTDQIGSAGVAAGEQAVNNAYSFLDNAQMPLDAPFAGTNAAIRAGLPGLPEFGPQVGRSMDALDQSAANGVLTGRDWQSGLRSTRANRSSLRGQPFADGAVNSLDDIENNLIGLAGRQGPPNSMGQLQEANNLNRNFRTLVGALDNPTAQRTDEMFTPQRLDTAARATGRNFGGQTASVRGGRPFYDLTRAGMDVMPNEVPDSGTAGRAIFYSALPGLVGGTAIGATAEGSPEGAAQGAGMGSMATLAPTLALAALYSEPAQRRLGQALLGPRSAVAQRIGQVLGGQGAQMASGGIGGALMRDLLLYGEIPQ